MALTSPRADPPEELAVRGEGEGVTAGAGADLEACGEESIKSRRFQAPTRGLSPSRRTRNAQRRAGRTRPGARCTINAQPCSSDARGRLAIGAVVIAATCAALFARSVSADAARPHTARARRRRRGRLDAHARREAAPPLLATLVQTHTDERIPVDAATPSGTRFDALLADRATGSTAPLDPRLLELLRTLAREYGAPDRGAPAIELVSGFRSPKLNEMMRKKGHHVASHSQHSLGHAVDFRIVVPCAGKEASEPACAGATALALDPRVARAEDPRGRVGRRDRRVHGEGRLVRTRRRGPPSKLVRRAGGRGDGGMAALRRALKGANDATATGRGAWPAGRRSGPATRRTQTSP